MAEGEKMLRGELLMSFAAENQGSLVRQRELTEIFGKNKDKFDLKDKDRREKVNETYKEIVGYIPATEDRISNKLYEAGDLKTTLSDPEKADEYLSGNLVPGLKDLRDGKETKASIEVLKFGNALIGLKLSAIKEANEWMGRGGPPTMEAQKAMDFRQWREKFGEPVKWVGRDYEQNLALKISNVLLTTGADGGDVRGLINLIEAKKAQYGSMGDYVGAMKHLSGDEREPGAMNRILEVGSRSGVSIEGLRGAISSLTPGDIVALANLTWSFKIEQRFKTDENGNYAEGKGKYELEERSLSVGQVLEKLLSLEGGRKTWTDPYWTGTIGGGFEALLTWMKSNDEDNPFRDAETGMLLDPGFNVYSDAEPRNAGVMDGGTTSVENIIESEGVPKGNTEEERKKRKDIVFLALVDGSPIVSMYLAAKALGILTQPIQRLYGAKGIMEALPAVQKIHGGLYDTYYTNQTPYYRKRAFISLMSMTDRAQTSPLDTIKPLSSKNKTMDGFAFMEMRTEELATKGGVKINKERVENDLKDEFEKKNGRELEGQELTLELNNKLNKIDVVLLNIFGCPIDDPGSFEQEFAVARIVGIMNDKLISPTGEVIDNPIIKDKDLTTRRKIAIEKAREYFRYQVDLAMSYTDKRVQSIAPLTTYKKYVHVPPEMAKHRLKHLEDEYKQLLGYVDFSGLLKRWKAVEPEGDTKYYGVKEAERAVEAMGVGVMATLPGGTKDLNTPFQEKQGNYWEAEKGLYENFSQAYQLSLQVLDDDVEHKVGMKIGNENELNEAAYRLVRDVSAALRGVGANENIRGGAIEQYFKWIQDTAPNTTFIGGKPPVVTFFHIAAMVSADLVGKAYVPPYVDKDKRCYLLDKDGKTRKHVPLGVNDDPAEYGDFYKELPEDILALVGVERFTTITEDKKERREKEGEKDERWSGDALISPGRMTSLSVIGMQEGKSFVRESDMLINSAKYAGSKKIMFGNSEKAYALMLQATFNQLCDLGLADPGERKKYMGGLTVLPDTKKAFELE